MAQILAKVLAAVEGVCAMLFAREWSVSAGKEALLFATEALNRDFDGTSLAGAMMAGLFAVVISTRQELTAGCLALESSHTITALEGSLLFPAEARNGRTVGLARRTRAWVAC